MNKNSFEDQKKKLMLKICKEGKIKKSTLGNKITNKKKQLSVSSNTALVLVAEDMEISCQHFKNKLSQEDRNEMQGCSNNTQKTMSHARQAKKIIKPKKSKSINKFINYETSRRFVKGHIDEFNRAYSNGCYTSAFILARKIVENLIIDILRDKFPENEELYYDDKHKRFKDFSKIINNLRDKKDFFRITNKAVERLCDFSEKLKKNTSTFLVSPGSKQTRNRRITVSRDYGINKGDRKRNTTTLRSISTQNTPDITIINPDPPDFLINGQIVGVI